MAEEITGIITQVQKNGNKYHLSTVDVEKNLALAKQYAEESNLAMVAAQEVVTKTHELVGGGYIPHFDSSVANDPYDLVFYEGKIWRALVTHNPGDAWNPTQWFKTSLYEEIVDMRSGDRTEEEVSITVTTYDGGGNLDKLPVSVTIDDNVYSYELNATGQVTFTVPKLKKFTINIETLSGYRPIQPQTYYATADSLTLQFLFGRINDGIEILTVVGSPRTPNGAAVTPSPLEGAEVAVTTEDGMIYENVFANNQAVFNIPYGKTYTINYPTIEGYSLFKGSSSPIIASLPTRKFAVTYRQNVLGIYGMDENGNKFTEDEITANLDYYKTTIKYIAFTASGLNFFFKISDTILSKSWCSQNIPFDTTKLPFLSNAQAMVDYNGSQNTDYIISLAEGYKVEVPAAIHARSQSVTLGSGDTASQHVGYLPAMGQLWQLKLNWVTISGLIEKLGVTPYNLDSGGWWSSSQGSDRGAWYLGGGSLGNDTKTTTRQVLPFFDL